MVEDGQVSTYYGPDKLHAPIPGTDASNFIQWKGTDVCIDLRCPCSHHSHFDGDFAHFVKCAGCGSVYQLGTQVLAVKVVDREPYIPPLEDPSDDA